MSRSSVFRPMAILLVTLIAIVACASDGDGKNAPVGPEAAIPSPAGVEVMFVQNADGAEVRGDVLVMRGVGANLIMFSDRPSRTVGHVTWGQFEDIWNTGENSFVVNPPNAVLSVLGRDPVESSVVTLRNPRKVGGDVHYDITLLDGSAPTSSGPASLFIDPIVVPAPHPAYVVAPPPVATTYVAPGAAAAVGVAAGVTAAAIANNTHTHTHTHNWNHHGYHGDVNINRNVNINHNHNSFNHNHGGGFHAHRSGGMHRHGGFHRR